MKQTFEDVLTARGNTYKDCFLPVFKVDCHGRPYHYGTIFAVTVEEVTALVTAAHVLERDPDNECDVDNSLYVFKEGVLSRLPDCDSANLPIDTRGTPLDLRVLLPKGWDVTTVIPSPIPEIAFRKENLHTKLYAVALGFPTTKNRRNGRTLHQRPYGYFGLLASHEETSKAGYDNAFFFSISFDLKRSFRKNQKEVPAASPHGISGGPVFIVHDFKNNFSEFSPQLAGIVIARDKVKKHLICIRGSFIFGIISELKRRKNLPTNSKFE